MLPDDTGRYRTTLPGGLRGLAQRPPFGANLRPLRKLLSRKLHPTSRKLRPRFRRPCRKQDCEKADDDDAFHSVKASRFRRCSCGP